MTATEEQTRAEQALDRAVERLLALQHPDGWWKGELETNVTIEAEDLFVRHFLGILTPEQKEATARWIRSKQRDDGSWATFFAGPADLSTTAEAYVALLRSDCFPTMEGVKGSIRRRAERGRCGRRCFEGLAWFTRCLPLPGADPAL